MAKKNQTLYQRGSKWRKWDLHIHCPDDVLNNQFEGKDKDEKWVKYIEKLEKSDIEVLGLTNYFCINGYEKIINFKNKGRLKNIKLILPNIEFRLSEINKEGEFINFHIIFSNKVSLSRIKSFLNRIYLLNTNKEGKRLLCTEENLKTVGYDKALIGFDIFDEIVKDFTPLRDYLIVGVIHGYGSFRPSKNNNGRKISLAIELDKRSHIIFGNKDNIEFFLQENRYEGAVKKPVILSSDAHNLETIGTKFSWIKADPTFEGLKQIIYEPKDRVKIQTDNPEPLKSFYLIDSIKINNAVVNKNLTIKEVEMPLNRNLVAVIGGKGSGKTALLDLIANCYPNKIDSRNKNSFVNRIFNEGDNLITDIKFLNQEKFSKKLAEQKFVAESDIEYIPQGQIENKIGNVKEFHNFLQDLIFKSDKVRNSIAYFEYQEREKTKREIEDKIDALNQEIFVIETRIENQNIDNIGKQLKLKETEKIDIQNKINSCKKRFTRERLKEINKIQKELSALKDKRDKLSSLRRLIKNTLEKFSSIADLNKDLETIRDLATELKLKYTKVSLIEYDNIRSQIENINEEIHKELISLNENIEKTQREIEKQEKDKKEKKKYGLVWEDKPEDVAVMCKEKLPVLKEVKSKEIITDKEKPVNLLIEGDNYHALSVLNYTHAKKVDVIYIDPPYNTGSKDFKYNDRYVDTEDSYRHSKWLSFMEKRLRLAKNLLKNTGAIFIQIDDNEIAQLRLLCDEIFGPHNFRNTLVWAYRTGGSPSKKDVFGRKHDYILLYSRSDKYFFNRLKEKIYYQKNFFGAKKMKMAIIMH